MSAKGDMAGFIEYLAEVQRYYRDILVEYHDCIWYLEDQEMCWNTEDNLEDLANGDGSTYGGSVPEGSEEIGNYTIMNIDTQMGTLQTIILPNNKRKTVEDLENV